MPPRRELRRQDQGHGRGQVEEEVEYIPVLGQEASASGQYEPEAQYSAVAQDDRVSGGGEVPPAAPVMQQVGGIDEELIRQVAQVVQAMTGVVQPQPPAQTGASNLEQFRKMKPPSYDGVADIDVADQFLDECEKILEGLEILEDATRIALTGFQLTGRASTWWRSVKRTEGYMGLTWDKFTEKFRDYFFPPALREAKRDEFIRLVQGDMTVMEYERRFSDLSKYGPEQISTAQLKCRKFAKGLRTGLRNRMVMLRINDYAELVDRAVAVEIDLSETKAIMESRRGKKARDQQEGASKKKPKRGDTSTFRRQQGQTSGRGPRSPKRMKDPVCFSCHLTGHRKTECPFRPREQSEVASQRESGAVVDPRSCNRCGQPGHIKKFCPLPPVKVREKMGQGGQRRVGSFTSQAHDKSML